MGEHEVTGPGLQFHLPPPERTQPTTEYTGDMNRISAALIALVMALWASWASPVAVASDICLRTQLLWGTDEDKPADSSYRELDPKLKQKLSRVFKWKNYFENSQQKVTLGGKDAKRLKLSAKCEIELRFVDDNTLEIKLFGEGKLTKTIRQSVKALNQGELAVLAGDDKEKYNDAWFVVLSASSP